MDRLRIASAALLVASLALGGVAAADFGNTLDAIDATGVLRQQVSVEVLDASLRDDRFVATVRFENPTRYDIELLGAKLRVHNRTERRIASGAGTRLDDNGSTLPSRGTLTVTYEIRLAEYQVRPLRYALGRDARLSMSAGFRQRDAQFSVTASGLDLTEEEGSLEPPGEGS